MLTALNGMGASLLNSFAFVKTVCIKEKAHFGEPFLLQVIRCRGDREVWLSLPE